MDHIAVLKQIVGNVEKVIVDKREAIELTLVALICRGHILIEDVPGVGKTSLASALAKSLGCSFKRIQFTPDIMPSDITGFTVYNPKTGDFEYKKGVILSQIILADEINRTSPKTQSSLLEAMEEKQVTVDGVTYKMDEPFLVLATQNPIEYLGTYPLPEAQMDRFFMRISLGYPAKDEEMRMVSLHRLENPLDTLAPVAGVYHILELQKRAEQIHVNEKVNEYIVNLVRYTRESEYVALGASPRASINLYKAGQAWAMYQERDYVLPDDIIKMCGHVLEHRIILRQEARLKHLTQADLIKEAIEQTPIPAL